MRANIVREKYGHIISEEKQNAEVNRYNFFLYQLEQMRKAEFVRIDNEKVHVDLTSLKGFCPVEKKKEFSPLLVTPNINVELNGYTETYEQLMDLPNNESFANEFYRDCDKLYIAEGYSKSTVENNMILQ